MKKVLVFIVLLVLSFVLFGCDMEDTNATEADINGTIAVGEILAKNQPTPTDISYSLERLNLIARAYWVNGQRDKALTVLNASPVPLPLGYIVLFSGPTIVAQFTVMGKVSSLNSWLTPDYWYANVANTGNSVDELVEMPDIDGTYGTNSEGIFFFTVDGKYIEWTGTYIYSDMYLPIDNPVINTSGE